MMVLLNYPIKIIDIPFKRGLLYVQSKQDHALFNVTRKPSRENTVKWVGPLQSDKAYFYELKSAPTEIQTLEDAKKIGSSAISVGKKAHSGGRTPCGQPVDFTPPSLAG